MGRTAELSDLCIDSGSPAEFLGSNCMQRTECRTVVYSEDMKWSHDGGTLTLVGNTLHCMFKGWSLVAVVPQIRGMELENALN